MFGLFESDDGDETDSTTVPGEGVEMGCTAHHFEEYEVEDVFQSRMQKQTRHFDSAYQLRGQWHGRMNFRNCSPVDERWQVVVERKHVATCEHKGCSETDVQWREDSSYVHEEKIESTPGQREKYVDGDDDA